MYIYIYTLSSRMSLQDVKTIETIMHAIRTRDLSEINGQAQPNSKPQNKRPLTCALVSRVEDTKTMFLM